MIKCLEVLHVEAPAHGLSVQQPTQSWLTQSCLRACSPKPRVTPARALPVVVVQAVSLAGVMRPCKLLSGRRGEEPGVWSPTTKSNSGGANTQSGCCWPDRPPVRRHHDPRSLAARHVVDGLPLVRSRSVCLPLSKRPTPASLATKSKLGSNSTWRGAPSLWGKARDDAWNPCAGSPSRPPFLEQLYLHHVRSSLGRVVPPQAKQAGRFVSGLPAAGTRGERSLAQQATGGPSWLPLHGVPTKTQRQSLTDNALPTSHAPDARHTTRSPSRKASSSSP